LSALIVLSFGAILMWGKDAITRELNEAIRPLIMKLYNEEYAQDFTELAGTILQST
ncbi:unnamed protein product, partial [Schistosoma turkestanicum]